MKAFHDDGLRLSIAEAERLFRLLPCELDLRRWCVHVASVANVEDLHFGLLGDDTVYDPVVADANAAETSPRAM